MNSEQVEEVLKAMNDAQLGRLADMLVAAGREIEKHNRECRLVSLQTSAIFMIWILSRFQDPTAKRLDAIERNIDQITNIVQRLSERQI